MIPEVSILFTVNFLGGMAQFALGTNRQPLVAYDRKDTMSIM